MASRKRTRAPEASASSIDYTLRSNFEVVPWKDVWEFQSVGEALLSAASTDCHPGDAGDNNNNVGFSIPQALATVERWRHRVAFLPHGVEATAGLASVRWRDVENRGSFLLSQTELRLAYAGAIIRAVNGLVDTLQQSRTVAMSISQLSVQLGLPNWLVDIRHEATHNQLPTLPVLRMGATMLLDYFRAAYWRPTQEAAIQTEQGIYQALQDYEYKAEQEAFKRDKGSPAASMENNSKHGIEESVEYMAIPSEDEEDERNEEDEKVETTAPVVESRLGTNFNMFALLMDPPKKKKGKKGITGGKTNKEEKKPTKKAKSKKKTISSMTALPSLAPAARHATQGKPLPVLWHCFVTHMVWGRQDANINTGGALIQACDQRAQRKYHTLLSMVGRDLPGLMQALLVHLVDFVLRCGGESAVHATIAVSWVKYLLSRRFVLASRKSEKWSLSRPTDEIVDHSLLHFDLPVKSLWERCRNCHTSAISHRAVVQTLIEVLAQVLGEEDIQLLPSGNRLTTDIENFETRDNEEPQMSVEPSPTTEQANDLDAGKMKSNMSLEDIESMLSGTVKSSTIGDPERETSQVPLNPAARVNAWTRCTFWEACPIGSLPGYPT